MRCVWPWALGALLLSPAVQADEPERWPAAPPERPGRALLIGSGAALLVGAAALAGSAAADYRTYNQINAPGACGEGVRCAEVDVAQDLSSHVWGSSSVTGRGKGALIGAGVAGGVGAVALGIGVISIRF